MSGSTIGGIVGGVIGFFVGGPAGAQVGFMLGSAVGGYIDPDVIEGPRLKDAMTQTSQDGIPKPWGRGTFRTAGNIIWSPTYPDGRKFREVKKKKRAGKGGPVQVTYSYFRSYAIGICTGKRKDDGTFDPIAGVIQVYRSGKLVYDARDDATLASQGFNAAGISNIRASSARFMEKATFYLGGEDIMPDATMESFQGIGNVSPNRGLVKMVINEDEVTETQGAIPQYEFVVSVDGIAIPDDPEVDCDSTIGYGGGESFPSVLQIELGICVGRVDLHYAPGGIPDKFILEIDGEEVLNSGYRGNTSFQTALNAELASRGLQPETIHPGDHHVAPGGANLPPFTGTCTGTGGCEFGIVSFHKATATSAATLKVYAPLSNTGWSVYIDCPDSEDLPSGWSPVPGNSGWVISPSGELYRQCDAVVPDQVESDRVVLGDIVADICKRCGLTAEDYDVSQLTDLVDGYKVAVQSDGVGMLLPLMAGFFFDAGEWDDKIRFIKRGGSSVMALSYDDLIAKDGSAFEITRSQEVELLRKVNVIAMDPAAGWMPTQQSAERRSSTVSAKGEQTVEIPIVADKDTQAQIADKRLKVPWAELHKYAFAVPYTQAALTPTDVVTLTDKKGITHRMRIMEMPEEGGIREVKEAAQDRQFTYTSNAVGTDHPPPNTPIEGLIGPTTLVVMNLPIWTGDQDDELGLYVAGFGPLSGWAGAEVQVSTDGGATHEPMAQITDEATIGYTTTALPAWASSEYPSVQSVTVWLPDAPESVTYENLLRYNNRAAIQNDSGEWEILQYETVTSLGSGSYELSGLVRGRYNTTAGAAGLGASFVLLDGNVQFVRIDRSFIGVAASIRAVSYGTDPDAYPWMPYTLTSPKSQTEWPVHMVRASRDISDNVTVTWIGRARIGTETSPQHSQYFRGYRVSFDDGGSVQTFDTTATTYTLNAAPDPVTVTVAPLNAITGAGPASTGIIV